MQAAPLRSSIELLWRCRQAYYYNWHIHSCLFLLQVESIYVFLVNWISAGFAWQYDLRNSSCLPAIKDQGNCGDCYAFSATTPIEYQYCIKYKTPIILNKLFSFIWLKLTNQHPVFDMSSEKQLTDCTYMWYGMDSCNGGTYEDTWSYLISHGQEMEASYPWRADSTVWNHTFNSQYDRCI